MSVRELAFLPVRFVLASFPFDILLSAARRRCVTSHPRKEASREASAFFAFVMMDKDIVLPPPPPPPPSPSLPSISLPLPVCWCVTHSSLASSSVCDSPSILARALEHHLGLEMRPLHKWQSLNALFYLHRLSPGEVKEGGKKGWREGGREDRTDPFLLFSGSDVQDSECAVFTWRRRPTPTDGALHARLSL